MILITAVSVLYSRM